MAGKGGKGLVAGKTTAAAAAKEKDKKKPMSRSARAGLQVLTGPYFTPNIALMLSLTYFQVSINSIEVADDNHSLRISRMRKK